MTIWLLILAPLWLVAMVLLHFDKRREARELAELETIRKEAAEREAFQGF